MADDDDNKVSDTEEEHDNFIRYIIKKIQNGNALSVVVESLDTLQNQIQLHFQE